MSCTHFKYCASVTHGNFTTCDMMTEAYFLLKANGISYYICPICLTKENISWKQFLSKHGKHLTRFSIAKKRIGISNNPQDSDSTSFQSCTSLDMNYQSEQQLAEEVLRNFDPISACSSKKIQSKETNVCIDSNIIQSGAGLNVEVRRKYRRKANVVNSKEESDLNRSHIILTYNMSSQNTQKVFLPNALLEDAKKIIIEMGEAKIQFGIQLEFSNEIGEIKQSYFSNKARKFDEDFTTDGVDMLNEKIEKYSSLSSGWHVLKLLEISLTLTKTANIMNLSGN